MSGSVEPSPAPMTPMADERITRTSKAGSLALSAMAARNPALPPPRTMNLIHGVDEGKIIAAPVRGNPIFAGTALPVV